MSKQTPDAPTTIRVDPNDSLPAILEKIKGVAGKSAVLEIPDHCPVLLTATEFRTVKELADREGIELALHTDDRLRMQLASMFGLRNMVSAAAQPTEGWRPPQTMLGSPRAYGTWKSATKDPETDGEEEPTAEPEPGTRSRRRKRGDVVNASSFKPLGEREEGDDTGALDYLNPRTAFLNARNIGRIVAVVLVLGILAFAAGWYYMPAVTVRATLKQEPVGTELIYSVSAPGAQLPSDVAFSAPATEQSATVEFTIRVPSTGVQRTPDKTAAGSVQLRNPGESEVTVPKGTSLSVYKGTAFTTNDEVKVPAAKDGQPGEAAVDITAAKPGGASNLPVGMLTGRLDDLGIFYSNRDKAIEGGTDREVKIVSEADIAKLEEQVKTNLGRATADGWTRQLPEGQAVVGPSVQASQPDYSIAQKPGDVADEVTLTGTVDATGLVYDLADVKAQAQEFFQSELQAQVPEGYALDASSVTLGEPEVLAEAPDGVQYRVAATGVANAVFDDSAQAKLAEDLAGGSRGDAEASLAGVSQFASWDLTQSPGWWPKRMPQGADRVTVEVSQATAPAVSSTPEPSPSPEGGQ
ncbi:MAG TPA: hypothetical protein VM450_08170 [Thermomicrobiales bacterium]|nr:hypothetical protein [Thermomicrobiales bacterium]